MLNSLVHARDPQPIIFMVSSSDFYVQHKSSLITLMLLFTLIDKILIKLGNGARIEWEWHLGGGTASLTNSNYHLSKVRWNEQFIAQEAPKSRYMVFNEEKVNNERRKHLNVCQEWSLDATNWYRCHGYRWRSIQVILRLIWADLQRPSSKVWLPLLVQIRWGKNDALLLKDRWNWKRRWACWRHVDLNAQKFPRYAIFTFNDSRSQTINRKACCWSPRWTLWSISLSL